MEWIRITSQEDEHFNACWKLYESAFPIEEIRELDYQLATLPKEDYHFEAIINEGKLAGFIAWWNLDETRYIEHFAIAEELRNKGYGKIILEEFIARREGCVLLEIEHLDGEMQKRRAGFYKRIGFQLNPHAYSHPPYRGKERVSLLIMTHPHPISKENLEAFCSKHHPKIHCRHYS